MEHGEKGVDVMRTLLIWALGICLSFIGIGGNIFLRPEFGSSARAQAIPKSLQPSGSESATKDRKNRSVVGVAGGLLSGTYMRFADELAQVLDDGDNLRVLPIVTYGAASNLDDLLYLRGVDVAITQSDVFEYFRTTRKIHNLESRVHYVIRLPVSEMHVLARTDIRSIEDLRGKKVNFGPPGSASSLTGSIVFQRLGIHVEAVNIDNPTALQKIKTGEIAALVRVIGKPVDFFEKLPPNSGLHFVSIPFSQKFADYYTIGEFTKKDYPTLIGDGERVDTIAVPAVLAVFNWPKNTERYERVRRFVEALFTNWEKFRHPPRHPKWRDVNLAATVPGWQRWSVATEMLAKLDQQHPTVGAAANVPSGTQDFAAFLAANGGANMSIQQRDALFRQFVEWQQRHAPHH
jgi:TRAP transporter TAXI family solute receptor